MIILFSCAHIESRKDRQTLESITIPFKSIKAPNKQCMDFLITAKIKFQAAPHVFFALIKSNNLIKYYISSFLFIPRLRLLCYRSYFMIYFFFQQLNQVSPFLIVLKVSFNRNLVESLSLTLKHSFFILFL